MANENPINLKGLHKHAKINIDVAFPSSFRNEDGLVHSTPRYSQLVSVRIQMMKLEILLKVLMSELAEN